MITFVTSSKGKVREAEKILNIPLEAKQVDLDEIQELSLEKIALHKVNQAFSLVKKPVIVDDVSLEIDAWKGFPGPLIKWILKTENDTAKLLLKMLVGEKNRKATVRLAIGFHDGKKPHVFYGEVKGKIATEIRGDNGFGWDPVFVPQGEEKTYAQMSVGEKNKISHRRKALDKLKDFLKKH
ncbi:MAG: RdgB/HAM1 family non-canonical purine NTP pyrophosphatase [Candidatus Levybacteria bacterium]|nr:RdgB/HAM1 family non-canonical purine NTP pyrophosphatase [Candidatus Levybacteria bacterium]